MDDFDFKKKGKYYLLLSVMFSIVWTATYYISWKLSQDGFMALCIAFIISGLSLIIEHYISWEMLEFEIFGHETYGAIISMGGLTGLIYKLFKKK